QGFRARPLDEQLAVIGAGKRVAQQPQRGVAVEGLREGGKGGAAHERASNWAYPAGQSAIRGDFSIKRPGTTCRGAGYVVINSAQTPAARPRQPPRDQRGRGLRAVPVQAWSNQWSGQGPTRGKRRDRVMATTRKMASALSGFALGLAAMAARAQEAGAELLEGLPVIGKPVNGAMGFQPAVTEIARDQQWLDHFVLIIIAAVTLLVIALLLVVILRYNRRANPVPARFSHNTPIEIAWTLGPILTLVVIGVFSLPILFRS